MKTKSAKAKGRSLSTKVQKLLLDASQIHHLELTEGDFIVTSSGETGVDVKISPRAHEYFPYSIECKKHASFSVYKHYDQAVSNKQEGSIPILVIEANRRKPLVILDAETFFRYL
jgi:hypothetical protein